MLTSSDAETPEKVSNSESAENGCLKQQSQEQIEEQKQHQKAPEDSECSKSASTVEADVALRCLGNTEVSQATSKAEPTAPEAVDKVKLESTESSEEPLAPKRNEALDVVRLKDASEELSSSEGMPIGDGKNNVVVPVTHSSEKENEQTRSNRNTQGHEGTDENGGEKETFKTVEMDSSQVERKSLDENDVNTPNNVTDFREENEDIATDDVLNNTENQISSPQPGIVQELCAFYESAAILPIKDARTSSTNSLNSLDDNQSKEDELPVYAKDEKFNETLSNSTENIDRKEATKSAAKSEEIQPEQEQNVRPKQVQRDTSTATVVDIPPSKPEITSDKNGEKKDIDIETQTLIIDLQGAVQEHLNGREDALERAKKAEDRLKQLEEVLKSNKSLKAELKETKVSLESVSSDREHLLVELEKLRGNRDEHERKQIVLSNRLNGAKKKEAVKANLAEKLGDEIRILKLELENIRKKLHTTETQKKNFLEENSSIKGKYDQRIKKLESSVSEEKRLNDERKKKMKAFVENKQEELRDARSQNDELNLELSQTNRSLREHHSRWKQLHAQWVQSQTRNRELQRDINRVKKESESMSRLGDRMNEKLSQSAQETEEHRNKRMNAKQELMTLLTTLEAEREVSSKLRDSIKFTFTPKALSQQQILKESLRDFERELENLSQRLGKPLPHMNETPVEMSDDEEEADNNVSGSRRSRSEIDTAHLLSSLEDETQRVSQCIMAMTSKIDRMHIMISQNNDRSCATLLTDILAGVVVASEETSIAGSRMTLGAAQNYGQVPTVNH